MGFYRAKQGNGAAVAELSTTCTQTMGNYFSENPLPPMAQRYEEESSKG
jgi:hypothetical protein